MVQSRRQTVTKDQVFQAAEQLKEDGKNVTVNAVIALTGGSFSTVGPMVRDWKKQEEEQATVVIEMPDNVMEAVKRAAAEIWRVANQQANEQVEKVKAEAAERVSMLEEETAEYETEVRRLEGEAEVFERDIEAVTKRAEASEQTITKLQADKAALDARLADRDQEIERLRSQLDATQSKLDGLQAELVEIAKRSTEKSKKQ